MCDSQACSLDKNISQLRFRILKVSFEKPYYAIVIVGMGISLSQHFLLFKLLIRYILGIEAIMIIHRTIFIPYLMRNDVS